MKINKRLFAGMLAFVLIAAVGLSPLPVFAQTPAETTAFGTTLKPAAILNAGFEVTPTGTALNKTASNIIASTRISGWHTTETDNMIELWGTGFYPSTSTSPTNFGGITYYSASNGGNWFAEINANSSGAALYQDVYTITGSLYEWSFDHRGRNGTDAANMLLGDPGNPAQLVAGGNGLLAPSQAQPASSQYYQGIVQDYTNSNSAITNAVKPAGLTPWSYTSMITASSGDGVKAPNPNNPDGTPNLTVLVAPRAAVAGQTNPAADGWTLHKGYYTVPSGQALTRLEMYAAYATYTDHSVTSTGMASGNLVDNINFFPIAAPTQQTVYQYDPNPANPSMSVGYDLNADNTPVLNADGMPQILGADTVTPGFVYMPEFSNGVNISSDGSGAAPANSGAPYVENIAASPSYTTSGAGGNTIVAADPGLYAIPVDVYSTDPHDIVYGADGVTPDPDKTTTDPATGNIVAYVGTVTSDILVLPKHTVSGTVFDNSNSSGLTVNYTYEYQAIDPVTGLPAYETDPETGASLLDADSNPIPVMVASPTMAAITDENGKYSFDIPDASQVKVWISDLDGNAFITAPDKSGDGETEYPNPDTAAGGTVTYPNLTNVTAPQYEQGSVKTNSYGNDFIYTHTVSGTVYGLTSAELMALANIDYSIDGTEGEAPITVTGSTGTYSISGVPDGSEVVIATPPLEAGYESVAPTPAAGNLYSIPAGYDIPEVTADVPGDDFTYTALLDNDTAVTGYNTSVTTDVLHNDTVPSGSTVTAVTGDDPAQGTWTVDADPESPTYGQVVFTPAPTFSGDATATYEVKDADGNILMDADGNPLTATITVTVGPATGELTDDSAVTPWDTAVDVNVLHNDTVPSGSNVTAVSGDDPAQGTWAVDTDPESPTYDQVVFTPDPTFSGDATATYTVTYPDGTTGTATITVTVSPAAGDLKPDTITTGNNTPVTDNVLDNDIVPDGSEVTDVTPSDPSQGAWTFTPDGEVTFTPDPGFSGDATATYTVTYPDGTTDTSTITVKVESSLTNDSAVTPWNTAVDVDVLANDIVPAGSIVTDVTPSDPAQGTWAVDTDPGSPTFGQVTFTPDQGFSGDATAAYTVAYPDGTTGTAEVTVTVLPATGTLTPDMNTTEWGQPVTTDVLGNDKVPAGSSVTGLDGSATPAADGVWTLNADGTVTFAPDPSFHGDATATYTVTYPDGTTNTTTVIVSVLPATDSNDLTPDTAETPYGTLVTVPVINNDNAPAGSSVTGLDGSATPAADGTWTLNADGTVTFAPNSGFSGNVTATYTVTYPDGSIDAATVTVTVDPAADSITPRPDAATTPWDTPVTVPVLDNDDAPAGSAVSDLTPGDPSQGTWAVDTNPASPTFGQVTFTPDPGFYGDATATYTVTYPDASTGTTTVTVTVAPATDSHALTPDTAETPWNTPKIVNVISNDNAPSGSSVTGLDGSATPAADGAWTLNADGTVTFTPDPSFYGNATATYTVTYPDGSIDKATVIVTVDPATASHDPAPDTATTHWDTPVTVSVLDNDNAPAGSTVTAVAGDANGVWTLNADGTVTFTPDPSFSGIATATYTVTYPDGSTDMTTVTVTVEQLQLDVSGSLYGLPKNNTASDRTYTVIYEYTEPDGDPHTGSATVTEAPGATSGAYSFDIEEGSTGLLITAPIIAGDTADHTSLATSGPITASVTLQDFTYDENLEVVSGDLYNLPANTGASAMMYNLMYSYVDPNGDPHSGTASSPVAPGATSGFYSFNIEEGSTGLVITAPDVTGNTVDHTSLSTGGPIVDPVTLQDFTYAPQRALLQSTTQTPASTSTAGAVNSVLIPKTSDAFSLGLWALCLIGSVDAAAMLALLWRRRRQGQGYAEGTK